MTATGSLRGGRNRSDELIMPSLYQALDLRQVYNPDLFYDHLSTPIRVEDEQGTTVWSARIDPFGGICVQEGTTIEFTLRFPGQFADDETGLYYNRFRYYSPELGRYLEPDPEGVAGNLNQYAYTAYPLIELDVRGDNKRCRKRKSRSKNNRRKPRKKNQSGFDLTKNIREDGRNRRVNVLMKCEAKVTVLNDMAPR